MRNHICVPLCGMGLTGTRASRMERRAAGHAGSEAGGCCPGQLGEPISSRQPVLGRVVYVSTYHQP